MIRFDLVHQCNFFDDLNRGFGIFELCKLINLAVPGTIDERAINKKNLNTYTELEYLTLALCSAQAIGCNTIINIDNIDLSKGTMHLVLRLLWQIIRIGLFNQIDLQHCPGLFRLLRDGEIFDDLRRLSPEEIHAMMMDQIQNCNYSVELGKQLRFSLIGIQGKDIYDGNQTLTLVWQLMRAYTLSVLAQCTQSGDSLPADKDVVAWVNQNLASSVKNTSIRSFQDSAISDGKVVLDLNLNFALNFINFFSRKLWQVSKNAQKVLDCEIQVMISGISFGHFVIPVTNIASSNFYKTVLHSSHCIVHSITNENSGNFWEMFCLLQMLLILHLPRVKQSGWILFLWGYSPPATQK
ncbi:unnamed protein product [Caenorhabditis angaria]|uniref:Calponin-homology (CH) domain-containing protein n=1 Tax=Caenorhabditis angaria TaxID=860376 RepID=A0A9P1N208_9PELO|nr:unnamed protein product [Caenorhabditis angaria]